MTKEKIISLLIERFKNLTDDEVYIGLENTGSEQKHLIIESTDRLNFELNQEANRFAIQLIGHIPKRLVNKWILINIVADSLDEYQGDTKKIVLAIAAIEGKKISASGVIDWRKYESKAKQLVRAHENLYELKAYPIVQSSYFYLKHFYDNFHSLEQVSQARRLTLDAIKELASPTLTREDVLNLTEEKYLEYEMSVLTINSKLNMNLVQQAVISWKLIPQVEMRRLLEPANRADLLEKMITISRVLRVAEYGYNDFGKKTLSYDGLVYWLRESVKRRFKLDDYANSLSVQEARYLLEKNIEPF